MSILEYLDNIKTRLRTYRYELREEAAQERMIHSTLLVLTIFLIGVGSFLLGRLSATTISPAADVEGIQIEAVDLDESEQASGGASAAPALAAEDQTVVASRNGTAYHYPWCSGAKRIKEENKIYFASPAEARAAGYVPAANCSGLK